MLYFDDSSCKDPANQSADSSILSNAGRCTSSYSTIGLLHWLASNINCVSKAILYFEM